MSTYRSTRRDAAVADDYLANHHACRQCGSSCERSELGALGGVCFPCFAAYCRQAPGGRVEPHQRLSVIAKMREALSGMSRDPKRWARELRRREQSGERLSRVQRAAWRAALKGHLEPEIDGRVAA